MPKKDKLLYGERSTVGKLATELAQQSPQTRDPIAIQGAVQADYEKHLNDCLEKGKKKHSGDFYLIVNVKVETLFNNVIRNYFFSRNSCPTPACDQIVYRYTRSSESIEFIWVIPSQDACIYLKKNKSYVVPAEHGLLSFVLDFLSGKLDKKAMILNKEIII